MEAKLQRDRRIGVELITERQSWISHWRDLEQYFMTRKGRWLTTDNNRGDRRVRGNINNTPVMALRALAAGLMATVTSPSRPWFRLSLSNHALMELPDVREWLYLVELELREIFAKSNFYQSAPLLYRELGGIGTAAMTVEPDDKDVVRFMPLPVGSYCLGVGPQRRVDSLYREIPMNAGQVVRQFGLEKCSSTVRNAWGNGTHSQKVDVCHLVEPNLHRDGRYIDSQNLPWRSVRWEKAGPNDSSQYLRESGFQFFPVVAPRWDVVGEDVYGQSPAMEALGDAKALQVQEKRIAQAIDKFVDPPMRGSSKIDIAKASIAAGSMTLVDETIGGVGFETAMNIDPNGIRFASEDIARLEQRINHALFKDLFQLWGSLDDRDRTAEEIRAREQERLLSISPTAERLNEEMLDPCVSLTFQYAQQAGRIPPFPDALLDYGGSINVEYLSILSQSQKTTAIASIERVVNFAGLLGKIQADAGLAPEALDKIDTDQSIDETALALGSPPTIVRSDDAVAEIRAKRQQAQAAQQAAALAQQVAGAAKDLGSIQPAAA